MLTLKEQELFQDKSIEAAYIGWCIGQGLMNYQDDGKNRKTFLMRIRALVQSGAISAEGK